MKNKETFSKRINQNFYNFSYAKFFFCVSLKFFQSFWPSTKTFKKEVLHFLFQVLVSFSCLPADCTLLIVLRGTFDVLRFGSEFLLYVQLHVVVPALPERVLVPLHHSPLYSNRNGENERGMIWYLKYTNFRVHNFSSKLNYS